MQHLREQGYAVAVVERFIPTRPHPTKIDLWSMFDLIAISQPDDGVRHFLFVQTTSGSNVSARVKKCRSNPLLPALKDVPGTRCVVHGWRVLAGSRAYQLRQVEL